MDDFIGDFDDGFDEGEFMDDDSFEDHLDSEFGSDDALDQEDPVEHESFDDKEDNNEFDIEDSLILGGAMGLAYEAGLNEQERRQLLKRRENKKS